MRNKFDESALPRDIEDLTRIQKTICVILFVTEYCKECLIEIGLEPRYFCYNFQAYCLANSQSELFQISPWGVICSCKVLFQRHFRKM